MRLAILRAALLGLALLLAMLIFATRVRALPPLWNPDATEPKFYITVSAVAAFESAVVLPLVLKRVP